MSSRPSTLLRHRPSLTVEELGVQERAGAASATRTQITGSIQTLTSRRLLSNLPPWTEQRLYFRPDEEKVQLQKNSHQIVFQIVFHLRMCTACTSGSSSPPHPACARPIKRRAAVQLEQMDPHACGNICKLKWRVFHLLDFPLVLWLRFE